MVGFFLRRRRVLSAFRGTFIALVIGTLASAANGDYSYVSDQTVPVNEADGVHTLDVFVSITTNADMGALGLGNIVSWQWTVTDELTNAQFSAYSTDSTAVAGLKGELDATPQSLSFSGTVFSLADTGSDGTEYVRWEEDSLGNMTFQGTLGAETGVTWDIPTTNPIAISPSVTPVVPEPSTLVLFSGFGALGMVVGWRRRKQTAGVPAG